MPRRKKVQTTESSKGYQNEDNSLIVHLPIKTESKDNGSNEEIEKLQNEVRELREKLSLMMSSNVKNVKVIKNENPNITENTKKQVNCWWCGGKCDKSIILPDRVVNNKFSGIGAFCSYSCALSYNFEKKDEKVWNRCSLIYQLRDEINKKNKKDMEDSKISPAPPKEILKDYGGELSREEYNDLLDNINYSYIKLSPPMTSSTLFIEQRNQNTPELSQLGILGMKLKRTKTIVKNKFTLNDMITMKK